MKPLAIAASVLLGCLALCASTPLVCAQSSTSAASSSAHKASAKKKKKRRRHEPKQMAPTPDRITEIQDALARNGCYDGDPTGKWDAATVAGMRKFQGDHGLDATGKLDALTLQKLGLGSEIAGAFAPRPVTQPGTTPVPPAATPPATATPQPSKPSASPAGTSQTSTIAGASVATQTATTTATSTAATATTSKPAAPPQPQ